MHLKDITEFLINFRIELVKEAEKVHPKFFSVLNYNDITNTNFNYTLIYQYYSTYIKQKIADHKIEVKKMVKEYNENLILDCIELFDVAGYNTSTGEEVRGLDNYDPDNFIPAHQISCMYDSTQELIELYSYKPFWERDVSVTDGSRRYNISACYNPNTYIESARRTIGEIYVDLNSMLISSVKEIETFPNFFVKSEPIVSRESTIPKAVNRHKVLYALKEQLENNVIEPAKYYYSHIDADGKVTIFGSENKI